MRERRVCEKGRENETDASIKKRNDYHESRIIASSQISK
jgi:hypothetical protein